MSHTPRFWMLFWYEFFREDHGRIHALWKAAGMAATGAFYLDSRRWSWKRKSS